MSRIVRAVRELRRNEAGAVAIEYAVIAVALGVSIAIAVAILSGDVGSLWNSVEALL